MIRYTYLYTGLIKSKNVIIFIFLHIISMLDLQYIEIEIGSKFELL